MIIKCKCKYAFDNENSVFCPKCGASFFSRSRCKPQEMTDNSFVRTDDIGKRKKCFSIISLFYDDVDGNMISIYDQDKVIFDEDQEYEKKIFNRKMIIAVSFTVVLIILAIGAIIIL